MKIKANNANAPMWKDVYTHSNLPKQLEPLKEMSTNLWWVWNHEGAKLFGKVDPASLSYKRMEEILADEVLMSEINKVYGDFKNYMSVKPDTTKPSVAYFSMEYGLTNILKIYSGGLGILAGDYLKEASDSNIDMCAVGFLYRYGYFTQTLSMDGQQIANYEAQNFNMLPLTQVLQSDGEPLVLEVPYPGRTVYAYIWSLKRLVPAYKMSYFFKNIVLKIIVIAVICYALAVYVHSFFTIDFWNFLLTSFYALLMTVIVIYMFGLSQRERTMLRNKFFVLVSNVYKKWE